MAKLKARPVALRFRRGQRPPSEKRLELVIPASERLLGFSVGRAAGKLVVTAVREPSVLHEAGVASGARLLTLNGEDVSGISLEELTARAQRLANTRRVLVLAVD